MQLTVQAVPAFPDEPIHKGLHSDCEAECIDLVLEEAARVAHLQQE